MTKIVTTLQQNHILKRKNALSQIISTRRCSFSEQFSDLFMAGVVMNA